MHAFIMGMCDRHSVPPAAGKDLFHRLQGESFENPEELLLQVQVAATRIWTSTQKLQGAGVDKALNVEFCSLLNRALREDAADVMPHVVVIVRAIALSAANPARSRCRPTTLRTAAAPCPRSTTPSLLRARSTACPYTSPQASARTKRTSSGNPLPPCPFPPCAFQSDAAPSGTALRLRPAASAMQPPTGVVEVKSLDRNYR
jgi:hypothetical protein